MGLFKKKKPEQSRTFLQTERAGGHPFSVIAKGRGGANNAVYRELRRAVPVIDAAISKIIRLTGGINAVTEDKDAGHELCEFLQNVACGGGRGIGRFIEQYLDQLLTYGTAVSEIVLSSDGGEIAALYVCPLSDVELRLKNGVEAEVFTSDPVFGGRPVSRPELISVASLFPEPGDVYGRSLLEGLPFVSEILLSIYNTIGENFKRCGNLRFAVTYDPGKDVVLSDTDARDRADMIAKEWSDTMSGGTSARDFVAVGDVSIKVIGADAGLIDTNVPVRQMLEQIVAKTGLPPFLLGLQWSSSERMSAVQSDLLTSELEYYRAVITPAIRQICRVFLNLKGYAGSIFVDWNNINLQDEVELARARLINAQAAEKEEKLDRQGGNQKE